VRALLLAAHLDPRTIAAAKSLESPIVELGIWRPVSNGARIEILIDFQEAPPPAPTPAVGPVASRFRTGLRPEDVGA
jgi:hypothetical protein